MTHMLPRALKAIKPWLKDNVKDARFWDGKYDTTHIGEIELPIPTAEDKKIFLERFNDMPNPLADKEVIGVVV